MFDVVVFCTNVIVDLSNFPGDFAYGPGYGGPFL